MDATQRAQPRGVDARLAREHGCDGVMVSNHGGRQLDYTVSALRTLPEIAARGASLVAISPQTAP